MRNLLLSVIFLFSLQFSFLNGQSIAENESVKAQIHLLEIWIGETMDYYHIPGLAIGIVYDQDLVWSKGFGYADLESQQEVTTQTLFRIASISKLFTSMAIMQLRDAGKLNLDDPLKKHLKWFTLKNDFADGPEVTIGQVLTHSAGLPREAAFPYWTDHVFPSREEMIKALPDQEMIFEPETRWKYSNLGMALLGEVISRVSGMPYEDYIQKKILQPLNMNDTRVQLKDSDMANLATGYLRYFPECPREVAPFTDSKGITAAANLSSNVQDLAWFIAFQLSEDRTASVLKHSTRREMQRVHWLQPHWKSGWGLGFSISRDGERTLVGHGGWVAGYRSQIVFSPAEKVGVIVLMNTEDFSPFTIAKKALTMLAPAIRSAQPAAPEVVADTSAWPGYVGRYIDTSYWETEVLVLNKRLYLYDYGLPANEDPQSALKELFYAGQPHTYRLSGETGNGEKVIFEMEEGVVKRIKIGENYIFPHSNKK